MEGIVVAAPAPECREARRHELEGPGGRRCMPFHSCKSQLKALGRPRDKHYSVVCQRRHVNFRAWRIMVANRFQADPAKRVTSRIRFKWDKLAQLHWSKRTISSRVFTSHRASPRSCAVVNQAVPWARHRLQRLSAAAKILLLECSDAPAGKRSLRMEGNQ